MKLIQEIEERVDGKKAGLFECPVCLTQYPIQLRRGHKQKTCKDCRGTQNVTHGMSGTPQYYIWQMMRDRCTNPNNPSYCRYGAKGITVSNEWMTFEKFWEDMADGYESGLTLDRIDGTKGYCKENCQWLTRSENSAKTSKVRPVSQYHVARKPEYRLILIKEWPSARAAAIELGLASEHISVVCQGKRKTHGGYAWKYTDR